MTIELMTAAIRLATGNDAAEPRPGQEQFGRRVANAMTLGGQGEAIGIAPTGVGKSHVALSAAAHRAVLHGERSLISTESLSLQAQYAEKDAPTMVAAALDLTGVELRVAVLKGFSNYLCGQRVGASASALLGHDVAPTTDKEIKAAIAELKAGKGDTTQLADELGVDEDNIVPLIIWALEQHVGTGVQNIGDRFAYEGVIDNRDWNAVSISSSDCVGVECAMREICKPHTARAVAAEADIVITNHSMLAVQAANAIPVVIGSASLGHFHHLIVDEAHVLPAQVRAQGASEVSSRKILAAGRAVTRVSDNSAWYSKGEQIAALCDQLLERIAKGKDEQKLVEDDDIALGPLSEAIKRWVKDGEKNLKPALTSPVMKTLLKAKRAQSAIVNLVDAAAAVSTHYPSVARWVQKTQPRDTKGGRSGSWLAAHASPVDVSGAIRNNLWNTPETDAKQSEPVTGIAMSATLPSRFGMQIGMDTQEVDYPSPFDTAYGGSMLFIPRADNPADTAALESLNRFSNTRKFDTKMHTLWAAEHVVNLCRANGGAALVIGATVENGKHYAAMLRQRTDLRVLSQWDGQGLRQLMEEWREDENAVLVGTRSLMTGVDAPGQTCSLVILDRPPRAGGNPVDDARVEQIAVRTGDKWAADRFVYVADAAALAEQAAGRLIRSVTDNGMFALLDPRLLKVGTHKYGTPTRDLYMKSVRRFTQRTADKDGAVAWLEARHLARKEDDDGL